MIGQRLLRIGSLLFRQPITNGVAVSRAAHAESVDADTLAGWVMEEAEKRGVSFSPNYARRIVSMASRRRQRKERGRLAIATCHFNPASYRRLRENYLRFLHHIRWFGVPVFSAEVAFDGQAFPTTDAYIQVRASVDNVMWQKERLLNLIAERLPEEYTAIAWIDADVLFADPDWPSKALSMLQECPVGQLWSAWHCCDEAAAFRERLVTVGRGASNYLSGKVCSPGGAWAARRDVFPLYDAHIVGSGDATCLEGWTNLARPTCLSRMNDPMRAHFAEWAKAAYSKVRGRIGVLEGDVMHMYHGTRQNRLYVDRWKPLIENGFDPSIHIELDCTGLYRWSAAAPRELRRHVAQYFLARQEDD